MNDLHHPCELWAEPISLLAAGCLSPDEEREVRRHIETCSDCGERFGQLTELCSTLAEAHLPANIPEAEIVERVKSAVSSGESQRPLVRTRAVMNQLSLLTHSLDKWRWIMSSRVSRIAAAVLFVLAITGVAMLFHGSTTFAFADFVAPILEAKPTKCKMTVITKGPPVRTITSDVMILDGARMRQEIEMPDKSKLVMIEDLSQGKSLTLVAASKTATVLTMTNRPKNTSLDPFAGFRRLLLEAKDNPRVKRQPLGKKEIDGHRVVGFHFSGQGGDFSLWGNPETGLPVRFEVTMGVDDSTKMTLSDFVFNADMDESLFSVEPPAGYTVRNQKSDGAPTEEKSLIEMLRDYSDLCDGAFPDSLDPQTVRVIVFKKANIQIQIQSLWEKLASGKGKPNEEQRHKLEELLLKMIEGKLNEEQTKKIGEQLQEIIGTQAQEAAEDGEAQAQETEESLRAQFSELQQRVQRGLNFANGLPSNADAHYMGKGVSFGAADMPIFWYRPEDSTKYRVIYADLSVRDSDTPPNVTKGQPVPAPSGPKE